MFSRIGIAIAREIGARFQSDLLHPFPSLLLYSFDTHEWLRRGP